MDDISVPKSIGSVIQTSPEIRKDRSEKESIIKELYRIYTSPSQKTCRKCDNWKRYVKELKNHSWPNTKEHQDEFRKSKLFIKELAAKRFSVMLSRNSVSRLYEILSIAKDKERRGENAASFIMSNRFV